MQILIVQGFCQSSVSTCIVLQAVVSICLLYYKLVVVLTTNVNNHWFSFSLKVSRCGMIYMEPLSLGWRPLVKSWLKAGLLGLDTDAKNVLNALFERFVDPCLVFVRRKAKVATVFFKVVNVCNKITSNVQDKM